MLKGAAALTGGAGFRMCQRPRRLVRSSERDQGHFSLDQTPCGAVIHSHPLRLYPHAPDRFPREGMRFVIQV
jgi:hypothetical protein